MDKPQIKQIRFTNPNKWIVVSRFTAELSQRLGYPISQPDAILYAIKAQQDSWSEQDKAGTPGGDVSGNAVDIQAR